jgi:hypothetical protein
MFQHLQKSNMTDGSLALGGSHYATMQLLAVFGTRQQAQLEKLPMGV